MIIIIFLFLKRKRETKKREFKFKLESFLGHNRDKPGTKLFFLFQEAVFLKLVYWGGT